MFPVSVFCTLCWQGHNQWVEPIPMESCCWWPQRYALRGWKIQVHYRFWSWLSHECTKGMCNAIALSFLHLWSDKKQFCGTSLLLFLTGILSLFRWDVIPKFSTSTSIQQVWFASTYWKRIGRRYSQQYHCLKESNSYWQSQTMVRLTSNEYIIVK